MKALKKIFTGTLMLSALMLTSYGVQAKGEPAKKGSGDDKDKPTVVKADSLLQNSQREATEAMQVKQDSLPKVEREEKETSLSTVSYNIFFQLLYRFSFSEIFNTTGDHAESVGY